MVLMLNEAERRFFHTSLFLVYLTVCLNTISFAFFYDAGAATIAPNNVSVRVDIDENGSLMSSRWKDLPTVSSDASVAAFFGGTSSSDAASLYVRDVVASSTKKIALFNRSIGLFAALSGDGNVVVYWGPNGQEQLLSRYDRRTNSQAVVGDGKWPAANRDGSIIVYLRQDSYAPQFVMYDAHLASTNVIFEAKYPNTIANQTPGISSDGRFITFVANEAAMRTGTLWLYDRNTHVLERVRDGLPMLEQAFTAVSDDGRYISYYEKPGTIYVYDRIARTATLAATSKNTTRYVTMSGDGKFILYPRFFVSSSVQDETNVYDREAATSTFVYTSSFIAPSARAISRDGYWSVIPTCDARNSGGCFLSKLILISNPLLSPQTPTCTVDCHSNVLFLPGIESSRLYRPQVVGDPENRAWEPSDDDDVRDLYLKENGEGWRDDVYTKERDVLDELPIVGQNIYKSFISKMDEMREDGLINDWLPAAYDWRLSLDEILSSGNNVEGKIYYAGDLRATSTPYIIQELRRLAATSKSGKATIIAHSNGGLLAKQLTNVLGDEAAELIDKMIFVAVPQAGTPMAIAAGLHGYDQDIGPGGFILSSEVARSFASTSPMFYHLLPSEEYFTYIDSPVIQFDPALSEWTSRYGQTIDSKDALDEFLADSYGRVDAETGDTDQPIQLKNSLLTPARVLHGSLDNWVPPGEIELIQIAGWGVPTTVSGITYKKKGDGVKPEPNTTIDGDGTVVVPSALWTSEDTSVNYWVNLKKFNRLANRIVIFSPKIQHAGIMEVPSVLEIILRTVAEENMTLPPEYISTSEPTGEENEVQLKYALHSPLIINAFDNEGNHTGVSTTTGQIEEQIPGSYYMQFGETKYLFTDQEIPVHIVMEGYDNGTFTFEVQELHGDTVQTSTTWQDMPVTPDTEVAIDQQGDFSTLSALEIDKNGDGIVDYNLPPDPDGVVLLPKAPLTITADDKTIVLGEPIPALTATLSGFISGETLSTSDVEGAPECTTSGNLDVAGSYPITCTIGTLTSETYEFENLVAGTLDVQYRWDGFLAPIDNRGDQDANVFKAGSTVPVKFELKNTSGDIVQAIADPLWMNPQQLGPISDIPNESNIDDPQESGETFKKTGKQYLYNWKTEGYTPGYWYRVYVKLDDGTIYYVTVGLK